MPPATMLHRNLSEFEDLDDMERVREIRPQFALRFAATYSCKSICAGLKAASCVLSTQSFIVKGVCTTVEKS